MTRLPVQLSNPVFFYTMETVRSPLLSSPKIGFVIAVTLALSASTALEVSIISSRNFKVSGLSLT